MRMLSKLQDLSHRHKNKLVVLTVVAGLVAGLLVVFEKTIMKYASSFFGGC